MPTEVEYAYAAGLVDGEGSVLIGKRRSLTIVVQMTDRLTIKFMHSLFGGFTNKNGYQRGDNHRLSWTWQVSGRAAVELARALIPYSVTKRRQLEVFDAYDRRFPVRDKRNTDRNPVDGRWQKESEEETAVRKIASAQLVALRVEEPIGITADLETMGLDPRALPLLSCSFMGDDESTVWSITKTMGDEKGTLLRIRDTLESAPFTIGWNSSRFDIPYINTRLSHYGERTMFLGSHDDASVMFDDRFNNTKRTSLVNAAKKLNVTSEDAYKTPIDWDLWNAANDGNEQAMEYVTKHSEMDVILTKRIYDVLTQR